MNTIVALVDFSDLTAQVVAQATKLAHAFGTRLILMHVVPEEPAVVELGLASPTLMQPPSERRIEADYERLVTLHESLSGEGLNVSIHQMDQGNAAKVVEACANLGTDLIIGGSHHHSTLYHLFVGTFTSEVLKLAKCPVMIVPATAKTAPDSAAK
jgi:nucleotide-binding universal stress UspA family protein